MAYITCGTISRVLVVWQYVNCLFSSRYSSLFVWLPVSVTITWVLILSAPGGLASGSCQQPRFHYAFFCHQGALHLILVASSSRASLLWRSDHVSIALRRYCTFYLLDIFRQALRSYNQADLELHSTHFIASVMLLKRMRVPLLRTAFTKIPMRWVSTVSTFEARNGRWCLYFHQ